MPKREIVLHQVEGATGDVKLFAVDEPGNGGANHRYHVAWGDGMQCITINFQNGPVLEAGRNGLTNEALLAIVLDRLTGFQKGPYPCEENGLAGALVAEALEKLKKRTKERMSRGVEGKQQA